MSQKHLLYLYSSNRVKIFLYPNKMNKNGSGWKKAFFINSLFFEEMRFVF